MNAKIMEVFRSIQGEGPYAGLLQVFVRFFECNIHCSWCDTPASIGDTSRNYTEVSLEDLLNQVKGLYEGCHSVSITGGEPLVQVEFLKAFLPRLQKADMKVYLETNGILPKELVQVIDLVDIIAMDIKLPSSTKEKEFWHEHEEFLRIALKKKVFIKAVVSKDTSDEDIYKAIELVKRIDPDVMLILQPNSFDLRESNFCVDKCVKFQQYSTKILKDVRVTPQMHKFMKLR